MLAVAILQEDDMMVRTALHEDLKPMEEGNYYNMKLQDTMEQRKGWNIIL